MLADVERLNHEKSTFREEEAEWHNLIDRAHSSDEMRDLLMKVDAADHVYEIKKWTYNKFPQLLETIHPVYISTYQLCNCLVCLQPAATLTYNSLTLLGGCAYQTLLNAKWSLKADIYLGVHCCCSLGCSRDHESQGESQQIGGEQGQNEGWTIHSPTDEPSTSFRRWQSA